MATSRLELQHEGISTCHRISREHTIIRQHLIKVQTSERLIEHGIGLDEIGLEIGLFVFQGRKSCNPVESLQNSPNAIT